MNIYISELKIFVKFLLQGLNLNVYVVFNVWILYKIY